MHFNIYDTNPPIIGIFASYKNIFIGEISSFVANDGFAEITFIQFDRYNYIYEAGGPEGEIIQPINIRINQLKLPVIEVKQVQITHRKCKKNLGSEGLVQFIETSDDIINGETFCAIYPAEKEPVDNWKNGLDLL